MQLEEPRAAVATKEGAGKRVRRRDGLFLKGQDKHERLKVKNIYMPRWHAISRNA
jgi:hypothetical protein